MTEPTARDKKFFLCVLVCASGIAGEVGTLINAARRRHWDVGAVAAPQGLGFLDAEVIEARTGYPIRSAWRTPGQARPLPPADADAVAVAPATFNTSNKWAAGISDTLALGILWGAYGTGIPIAVLPCSNAAQAAHPAYRQSLERLAGTGIRVGSYEPHRPKAGGGADRFRWTEALDLPEPELAASVISAIGLRPERGTRPLVAAFDLRCPGTPIRSI
ncbi:flavoprotein [Streptomyces sp. NPDC001292]|uniref:flavoprotein n=1 Tax=Streptomyces sp. NPDC001292 TaxID=3364558 RepID=UPI0036A26AD8